MIMRPDEKAKSSVPAFCAIKFTYFNKHVIFAMRSIVSRFSFFNNERIIKA
jgi:hypothetical protein